MQASKTCPTPRPRGAVSAYTLGSRLQGTSSLVTNGSGRTKTPAFCSQTTLSITLVIEWRMGGGGVGKEGSGRAVICLGSLRGADCGFQVGQSGTATTAVLTRPCQAAWRAHRRGGGMAAQDEFPVLAQRHAAPSEFRTWVHGEAVCDLRGLGSPGKTIHLPSGLRQGLRCQNQNDAGPLPNISGLPSLPLQPFDR